MSAREFSFILRGLIRDSHMTYAQLAQKSGVSAKTILHWVRGDNAPSIETAGYVLEALGYKIEVVNA